MARAKFVRQGDNVDGALLVHQLAHAQEDALVRVEREVVGLEPLGRLGVRGIVEQNGAEDGLFGVDVRWQAGVERSNVRQGGHTESVGRRRQRFLEKHLVNNPRPFRKRGN